MLGHIWDFFVNTLMILFIPLLNCYYALSGDLFLNVSARDATGFERIGNQFLTPIQYLIAGREAIPQENGSWIFVQRFDYTDALWIKSAASITAIPLSLFLGTTIKSIGYLSKESRDRHASMAAAKRSTQVHSNLSLYEQMGIQVGNLQRTEILQPEGYQRRPGDENNLQGAKTALKAIGKVLTDANIPWWVDCGTLLGAYRYGGVIPWDEDIDMSILGLDFENARRALNQLDPDLYLVQDWSGRDFPDTFFKVYVRKTGEFIDIETYTIDPKRKEISSVFSLEKNIFFFEWWKVRERRFKEPIAIQEVFPLKKALFDGLEVFVPQNSKKFLQRYYGENLAPAKVYDPSTGRFEKDLSHPYWERSYVH